MKTREQYERSGAAWIVRDFRGKALVHSRRAFTGFQSKLEAELEIIGWAAADLQSLHWNRVIIEISSAKALEALQDPLSCPHLSNTIAHVSKLLNQYLHCHVLVVKECANGVANEIAVSVTRDRRYQSYVARGGPSWLSRIIQEEAGASVPS